MQTENVQTMAAPQPPRLRTEPPRAVSRKLGLASATTKPSNQLIALTSSRSSTEATAMTPPSSGVPGVCMQYAREAGVKGMDGRPTRVAMRLLRHASRRCYAQPAGAALDA